MSYRVIKGSTALGDEHRFEGPGMPQHANGVHFLQIPCEWALECMGKDKKDFGDREAERITHLLSAAFEAGKKEAKREIRNVLGIHTHWGSRED